MLYWGGLGFLNSQDIIPGILTTGDNMPKWVLSFNLIGKELNLIWPSGHILASINAIVTAIIGIIIGTFLLDKDVALKRKLKLLVSSGTVFIAVSLLWNILFPINKQLWTSSFTLLTAGIAILELAIFVFLVDVKFEDRKWRVMTAFGKNAMFAFLLHGFIKIPFYFIPIGSSGETLRVLYRNLFVGRL